MDFFLNDAKVNNLVFIFNQKIAVMYIIASTGGNISLPICLLLSGYVLKY